jgi:hypothetical protein
MYNIRVSAIRVPEILFSGSGKNQERIGKKTIKILCKKNLCPITQDISSSLSLSTLAA